MRTLAAAAFLAPAFVHSAYIPHNTATSSTIESSQATPEPIPQLDIREHQATFEIPCQADDEAFFFSVEILQQFLDPFRNVACGSSNVLFNGQALRDTWSDSQWFESINGRSNITALSRLNDLNRTLELSFSTLCLDSTLAGIGTSPLPATEGDEVAFTFVRIDAIDGRPSLSGAGFTVSIDQRQQQIVGLLSSYKGRLDRVLQAPPASSSESGSDHQLFHGSFDDEAAKLKYLQNELDALTVTTNNQKALVDELTRPQQTEAILKIERCHNVKCVAKHIYEKAKSCVHFVIVQLSPKNAKDNSEPAVDPDCYWTHSRQARMHAAMTGQKLCSGDDTPSHTEKPSTSAPKHNYNGRPGSSSTTSYSTSYSTSSSTDTIHHILVPIGVVASLLCLSCFTVHLHRHCCSPRAKAERAARREERRTRRQYARLACKHKWRTWWNQRLGRNTKPFSSDYEEKRSLIQAQERILENAMQDEIQRIRREAAHFDEECAQRVDPAESLPPYRSRAGSGRPPSYTSQPEPSASATVVPSVATRTNRELDDVYPALEITPDSSIANLSRRNSSDTLHTEHSIV